MLKAERPARRSDALWDRRNASTLRTPCARLVSRRSAIHRPAVHVFSAAAEVSRGFHQARLALQPEEHKGRESEELEVHVRAADSDEELAAAAYLRAASFYAYPPERAFAGRIHQQQIRDEEFAALKHQRERRSVGADANERSATLIGLCRLEHLPAANSELRVQDGGETSAVIGSLDLCAVRALPGEILIGNSKNAAYLANVCAADVARRRGVGAALIAEARFLARQWGADALFVHMLAVNEVARAFYEQQGFLVEKEESSNDAHYRGRCLDGIEGRGRSLLMRDSLL